MGSFSDWFLREELFRNIDFSKAMVRSGVDSGTLRSAHKLMTADEFLKNPPSEARGAYALGLSAAGGMKGIYFHISDALGLVKWPDAYKQVFGPGWGKMDWKRSDITDRFINGILDSNDKFIVFFLPNDAPAQGRFTREELEFFLRNPDKLKRVIFVLGAYDIVDKQDYQKLIAANRTQDQRRAMAVDVIKNARQHQKPGDPV